MQILSANGLTFTSFQVLTPILPLYVASTVGNVAAVGLVVGALTFAAVLIRPFLGWIIDQYGRKKLLIVSATMFGVIGLLYPFATSLAALVVIRMLQGLSWSGISPATSTIVADLIPPWRRGAGMAYQSTSQSIGMALGPAIGLYVADTFGYTIAFLTSAAIVFAGLPLALRVPDHYTPPKIKRKLRAQDMVEASSIAPSSITLLFTFIFGGLTAFVPLDAINRDLGNPAIFFVTLAVGLIIIRPITGNISDRQASRGVLLFPGIGVVAAALLVLSLTENSWTLIVTGILWAVGFGISQPVLRAMVLDRAPREHWGSANATQGSAFELGLAMGAFLLGILASIVGIPTMFLLSSLTMALAFVLVLVWRLDKE